MELTKWIADFLAAGIGGLIGATLGAYFKSYWAKKGEHLATYEDIKSLLGQEFGKAYEQEKGKRLATHEDIENVLREVKAVTRETEMIKAQIGSDFWTQQMVWQQKREIYSLLLKKSDALKTSIIKFTGQLVLLQPLEASGKLETVWRSQDLLDQRNDINNSLNEFVAAFAEANIFLSDGACAVLSDFVERYGPIVQDQEDVHEWTEALSILGKSTAELTKVAKEDLGVIRNA